ncbi:MAG: patatin-like phospholipase family protein [Holophagaceae bacterium]|nr:patatin-like phospholipase family protein [Holophagaceae bacterium]
MKPHAVLVWLLAPALLQGGELRLQRKAPDQQLRLRAEYRAEGQRPLSLVLGGGGAKGLLHIGVFEVLEEEGLTEDLVIGSSSGAMLGGLRAAGFSGRGLRWAFRTLDFGAATMDSRRRTEGRTFSEDEEREATVVRLDYRAEGWEFLPGEASGLAATQMLTAHLLRADALCGGDFAQLRMPFACIASNLSTGQLQCFTSGNLVTAVRASMSIPGMFRPVDYQGSQLVDGSVSQSLPVLEAQRLRPDAFQLAVDVSDPVAPRAARNPFALAGRSLAHSTEVMTGLNRSRADLLLRPRVEGFDFLDFRTQVDTLADLGRSTMAAALPALEAGLYGEDGALPLGATQWRIVGDAPPGLAALAQACLPTDRSWSRRDGYRLLRRALAQGLVAEAWLVLPTAPGAALDIHITPNPVIRQMVWEVPESWSVEAQRLAREHGLAPGLPFREPAWGAFLQDLLILSSLRGRPLLDLRGSALSPEGELRVRVREASLGAVVVDPAELLPASRKVMADLFRPALGKPLDTGWLGSRLLELEHSLNLQNPVVRLQAGPGEADWTLRMGATDRHRVQVNVAAAYETTWGLHGVVDAWLKDFLLKGNEWWLHAYGNSVQRGASLSLRHAFPTRPSIGVFAGARSTWHRFEGDPLLGYFGTGVDPTGYQRLIENSTQRTNDVFAGLFQRFGATQKGLAEIEYRHRESTLSPTGYPKLRHGEDSLVLSTEWDCLDRISFPTEGLLVRIRMTADHAKSHPQTAPPTEPRPDLEPALNQVRGAYLLFRALAKDLVGPVGVDLALEAGLGWRTLLVPDRQYILGGDASLIGTPSTRFVAPNFAILRIGLPIPLRRAFGGHVQLVPRLDYGRFAQDPNNLGAGMRALGYGLVLRGAVGKFYIETGWGQVQLRPYLPGPLRRESQLNVLVGARPFDLWTRN